MLISEKDGLYNNNRKSTRRSHMENKVGDSRIFFCCKMMIIILSIFYYVHDNRYIHISEDIVGVQFTQSLMPNEEV